MQEGFRFASEYTFLFKDLMEKSFIINKNDLNKHFNDGDSISVSTKPQTISNVTIEDQLKTLEHIHIMKG